MKKLIFSLLIISFVFSSIACAARKSEEAEILTEDVYYYDADITVEESVGAPNAEAQDTYTFRKIAVSHYLITSMVKTKYITAVKSMVSSQNPRFLSPEENPLSTFSIDVDTASYSNTRRMLLDGFKPDPDVVRVEEFINYFDYDYDMPTGDDPIALDVSIAPCPWNTNHALARITVQAEDNGASETVRSNFVFCWMFRAQ